MTKERKNERNDMLTTYDSMIKNSFFFNFRSKKRFKNFGPYFFDQNGHKPYSKKELLWF